MNAFFLPISNTFVFSKRQPANSVLICSKEGSMARTHWSMLRQFKMTDGSYMMSEELLMVIARIFKKDFEDIWNQIFLDDQIDLIRGRCSHTRTNEHEIDGLIMNIDV